MLFLPLLEEVSRKKKYYVNFRHFSSLQTFQETRTMSDNRTIMHVDMNAFFASVEQQSKPSLRDKPVAVIGAQQRTVITTSSYEARAYGVKVGMTVPEAKETLS